MCSACVQVLLACVRSPLLPTLAEELVMDMLQTCFRMSNQARLSGACRPALPLFLVFLSLVYCEKDSLPHSLSLQSFFVVQQSTRCNAWCRSCLCEAWHTPQPLRCSHALTCVGVLPFSLIYQQADDPVHDKHTDRATAPSSGQQRASSPSPSASPSPAPSPVCSRPGTPAPVSVSVSSEVGVLELSTEQPTADTHKETDARPATAPAPSQPATPAPTPTSADSTSHVLIRSASVPTVHVNSHAHSPRQTPHTPVAPGSGEHVNPQGVRFRREEDAHAGATRAPECTHVHAHSLGCLQLCCRVRVPCLAYLALCVCFSSAVG